MARSSQFGGGQRTVISAAGVAGICAGIALILLLILPGDAPAVRNVQRAVAVIFTPIIELASLPGRAIDGASDYFAGRAALQAENAVLKQENEKLRLATQFISQQKFENEQLRDLLEMELASELAFQGAEVLADLSSPFSKTVLVGAGLQDGVEMGQAVLASEGFYGRIIAVGSQSSRVLLASDLNSHIPVIVGNVHIRAILTGAGDDDPILHYVMRDAEIAVGDLVYTSGDGGQIPSGLLVGAVSAAEADNIRVSLAQRFNAADFVRILRKSIPIAPERDVGSVADEDGPSSDGRGVSGDQSGP